MSAAFLCRDVWKRYGATQALRGVTVEFSKGLNVLIGPNGSGKSTLLRILTGLARPDKGYVESLGMNPWKQRDKLLKHIGVVFEGLSLPWWLSGREALELLAARHGPASFSSIREYAEMLGVTEYWDRSIRGYSMGMRKKLMLAAGFGLAEEALILDEPYTLLDASAMRLVDGLIYRFSKTMPVIVATHVITTRVMMADEVVVLVGGAVTTVLPRTGKERGYICDVANRLDLFKSLAVPGVAEGVRYIAFDSEESRLIISLDNIDVEKLNGIRECSPGVTELLRIEKYLRGQNA